MNKIIEVAKTVDEAIQAGLQKLGVSKNDVEINIVVEPKKGFFGFGARNAEVELILKEDSNAHASVPVTKNVAKQERQVNKTSQNDSLDAVIEGKKLLLSIFDAMDLDVEIEESVVDGQHVLNIVGDNLGVLIGRRGQTLDALQYLLNISSNRNTNHNVRFVLDAENYRGRRKKTLESLAERLADKARRYKKDVVLEPMSPYERKIIHAHLQDERGISTRSQGQEPYRKIVISTKKGNSSGK